MKLILFYWSKGADMRVRLLNEIHNCQLKSEPCYLNYLASVLNVSHVAVKKHLDLLVEHGYVRELNPNGKPVYVELTEPGKSVLNEFKKAK